MIEALVTAPIESRIQQIRGIRDLTSVSDKDRSRIEITFGRDTDMDYVRFEINEILADYRSWLPDGIYRPQVQSYVPDELEKEIFISYRLLSPLSQAALQQLVEEKIK